MKRCRRTFFWALGFGVMLLPAYLRAQQAGEPAADKYTNAVVAVVNDKVITLEQLRKEIEPLVDGVYDSAHVKYPTDDNLAIQEVHNQLQKLEKELVHRMVDDILIIQAFYDKGMDIPPAYLDRNFDDSITTKFNGDHEQYLRYLQQNHLTEQDYRKQLKENSILQYMRSQLRDSVTGISPDRIKAYYEENKKQFSEDAAVQIRQIVLKKVTDETPEQLMQEANLIEQQAKLPNADFADLARRSSQDESAKAGGEAGWIPRDRLDKTLENVIFALSPGQVSDPVVSPSGNVYIFKCEDKRTEGIQPLDKVSAQIEVALVVQDERQAEEKWLLRLRSKAYIHFQDSFFNYD